MAVSIGLRSDDGSALQFRDAEVFTDFPGESVVNVAVVATRSISSMK